MTEQESKDTAAFFDSPDRQEICPVTPVFARNRPAVAAAWRQKLSTDILARTREEMKKKGIDF